MHTSFYRNLVNAYVYLVVRPNRPKESSSPSSPVDVKLNVAEGLLRVTSVCRI